MKARVIPRPEQARPAQRGQVLAQRGGRHAQELLVARSVGLEPVAIVVLLQLAQELDRLRRKSAESGHGGMMPVLPSEYLRAMPTGSALARRRAAGREDSRRPP